MNHSSTIWVFGFLVILSIPPVVRTIQTVNAFMYDNGTCTNENITNIMHNQTINTNGTVEDFLKSLPSDNTILAEIVCNNGSNETLTKTLTK